MSWSTIIATVSISVIPGSEMLCSDHSGQRRCTNLRASSTRFWKVRSSRLGVGSTSGSIRRGQRRIGGARNRFRFVRDDVEREDQVAFGVVAADAVEDVDVEGADVDAVEADANLFDVYAGLPHVQRGPHFVGDSARGGAVGW